MDNVPKTGGWLEQFEPRQVSEIGFARLYRDSFNHGTDGHNAKLIIAGMADALDALEQQRTERLKGKPLEAWAEDAYNRYFMSAEGKNFSGAAMPSWAELPEAIQRHWMAAIEGVI